MQPHPPDLLPTSHLPFQTHTLGKKRFAPLGGWKEQEGGSPETKAKTAGAVGARVGGSAPTGHWGTRGHVCKRMYCSGGIHQAVLQHPHPPLTNQNEGNSPPPPLVECNIPTEVGGHTRASCQSLQGWGAVCSWLAP